MAITFEQFKALRDKGLSPQQIANFESGKTPVPQYAQPYIAKHETGQAITGIAKGGYQTIKDTMNTGEMLLKEKAKQTLNQMIPGGSQLLSYAAGKLGLPTEIPSMADTIQSKIEEKKGLEPGTLLKANTPTEKKFKVGTEVVSLLAPIGKEKVLSKAKEGVNIAKKVITRSENLADIVSPKLTKAVREESLKAGEQLSKKELASLTPEEQKIALELKTPGVKTSGMSVFNKTSYNPSDEVKTIVDAIKSAGVKLKSGASEVGKNITRLKIAERKEFAKVGEIVDNYITGKGSKYIPDNGEEIISILENKLGEIRKLPQRTVDLAGDVEKIYDKIWTIAKEQLKENVTKTGNLTQKEILDALRKWNIKASETAVFEGKENIKKIAIQDVRKIFRDTLIESLPKNIGKKIDESFKKSHAFIDAMTNIAEKNQLLVGAKSKAQKAWSRVKKGAALIGGGTIIGGGASQLME